MRKERKRIFGVVEGIDVIRIVRTVRWRESLVTVLHEASTERRNAEAHMAAATRRRSANAGAAGASGKLPLGGRASRLVERCCAPLAVVVAYGAAPRIPARAHRAAWSGRPHRPRASRATRASAVDLRARMRGRDDRTVALF